MIGFLWRASAVLMAVVACTAVLALRPVSAAHWQWPLPGQPTVVRGFDPPSTPYGAGHRGVDLAGRPGVPVLAAGAGTVGYAGLLAGRGVVTVLHDGGLRTTYEPLTASVRPGERIAVGAVLGVLVAGHPGCSMPACLHWGLLRGETYLDPLALLGVGRVRLLPLTRPAPGATTMGAGAALVTAAGTLPFVLWLGLRRSRTQRRPVAATAAQPSSRGAE